ncbi:MAG: tetratricopeptide repeat protein [Candidatus Brocadiae bacterium]|nr:tetratricopeptide repeat protein [Candidatus Brocadiia bacterium]
MQKATVVSLLCGLLGGAGLTAALLANRQSADPVAAAPDPRLETVTKLETEVAALRGRIEALEKHRAAAEIAGGQGTAPSGGTGTATSPDPALSAKTKPGSSAEELAAAIEQVIAAGYSQEAIAAFLEKVRKDKSQGAIQAALRAFLERDPRNAQAHYLLARAYVDELMTSKSYADMERLGELCMKEYGAALDINPTYWEPRFERAISYTFYPEQLGMLPHAVRDFETLVAQQNRSNADPRFAETYSNLARVYVRTGKPEKAKAALKDALTLFPENKSLQQQLAEMEE